MKDDALTKLEGTVRALRDAEALATEAERVYDAACAALTLEADQETKLRNAATRQECWNAWQARIHGVTIAKRAVVLAAMEVFP